MLQKEIVGILATILAIIGYIPYFKDMFANRTKPHAFSWLVWGVLTGIGFFGQVAGNGGPGAWVTGFTALVCIIVFIFGIKNGKKNIVFIDWLSLIGCGIALLFWFITRGPLLSVIIISFIDALGFFPTFRKSYYKPFEETASTFVLGGMKFILAAFALNNFTLITALYPLTVVVMNFIFVAMLLIRRKQLHSPT